MPIRPLTAAVLAIAASVCPTTSAEPVGTPGFPGDLDRAIPERTLSRIAFGSCIRQSAPQHVWDAVNAWEPDAWLWLGDTIYADSPRPRGPDATRIVLGRMPELYGRMRTTPGYKQLAARAFVWGTWDDHDYGINDAGVEFDGKAESQEHFYDFYDEPTSSPLRETPGVYASWILGEPGRRVQLITLDTRSFRSALKREPNPRENWVRGNPGTYVPNTDPEATILGAAQWAWLEGVLRQPAELRIVLSSIQFVAEDHRFEKWANIPHERERMLRLIRDTGADGVVFISGDRHSSELSLLRPSLAEAGSAVDVGYPIYDLTSSALTNSTATTFEEQQSGPYARGPVVFFNEINRHRVGSVLRYNNFGTLAIDWEAEGGPTLTMGLRTDRGDLVLEHVVPLAALRSGR